MSTRRPGAIVAGAALAVSVAANVYLITRPAGGRAPVAATRGVSGNRTDAPPPPAGPKADAPQAPRAPRAARPALPTACPEQLDTLAVQLADTQRELERHLDLPEKFALASRSPATEASVQAFLATAFEGAPASLTHDLECHGAVCAMDIVEHEATDFAWMRRLQDPRLRGGVEIGTMGFGPGKPAQDPVTKEPLATHRVVFELMDASAPSGMDLLQALVAAYTASPEVAACKARFPAPGHLSLRLTLDTDAGTLVTDASGTLAVEPAGRCLVDELRRRTDATVAALAPGTTGAMLFFTVRVP